MRKVITACTSAGTVLLVILFAFLIYQWITLGVLENRERKLTEENQRLEQINDEIQGTVEWYESETGKLWLAFQKGFVPKKD